jgi:hypothetical protein
VPANPNLLERRLGLFSECQTTLPERLPPAASVPCFGVPMHHSLWLPICDDISPRSDREHCDVREDLSKIRSTSGWRVIRMNAEGSHLRDGDKLGISGDGYLWAFLGNLTPNSVRATVAAYFQTPRGECASLCSDQAEVYN